VTRLPPMTTAMLRQFRQRPDDDLDPNADLNPMADLFGTPRPRRPRRRAPELEQMLTPEEEKGVLGSVLSGVGYLAGAIDKPFAATRALVNAGIDVAQGDTPELRPILDIIPFSDTMGITDPNEDVTGRDVLTNLGAPENREGFHPLADTGDAILDIAGLAVDILAGPPVPVLGPLSKGAKAATKGLKGFRDGAGIVEGAETAARMMANKEVAGRLLNRTPHGIAESIRAGDRAAVGLEAPFGWK